MSVTERDQGFIRIWGFLLCMGNWSVRRKKGGLETGVIRQKTEIPQRVDPKNINLP